eukprot:gene5779-9600_t
MNSRIFFTLLIFTMLAIASAVDTSKSTSIKLEERKLPIVQNKNDEKIVVESINKKGKPKVEPLQVKDSQKVQEKKAVETQVKKTHQESPFQSLIDNFFNNNWNNHWGVDSWFGDEYECRGCNRFKPNTNIYENDDHFTIVMELPGLERKDVNIKYERGDQDFLTISGERKKIELGRVIKSDISFGKFEQKYQLKRIVDIKATFENGILKVHLQRKPTEKPKVVDVKIE